MDPKLPLAEDKFVQVIKEVLREGELECDGEYDLECSKSSLTTCYTMALDNGNSKINQKAIK